MEHVGVVGYTFLDAILEGYEVIFAEGGYRGVVEVGGAYLWCSIN